MGDRRLLAGDHRGFLGSCAYAAAGNPFAFAGLLDSFDTRISYPACMVLRSERTHTPTSAVRMGDAVCSGRARPDSNMDYRPLIAAERATLRCLNLPFVDREIRE